MERTDRRGGRASKGKGHQKEIAFFPKSFFECVIKREKINHRDKNDILFVTACGDVT